jgi:hypothetical protein
MVYSYCGPRLSQITPKRPGSGLLRGPIRTHILHTWCGVTRFARRGHHDGNHGEIAEAFISVGCAVADTSAAGFGFPDIVLGLIGQTHLVEVKDENGRLSASQDRFLRDWRGGPIMVVQTIDEAIAHVQRIRRGAR